MDLTVECPSCGQTIEVPDVTGKVQMICPVCEQAFVVQEAPVSGPRAHGGVGRVGTADDGSWHLTISSGQQYGPISADDIINWIRQGRVTSDDLVWRQGMQTWLPRWSTPPFSSHVTR